MKLCTSIFWFVKDSFALVMSLILSPDLGKVTRGTRSGIS